MTPVEDPARVLSRTVAASRAQDHLSALRQRYPGLAPHRAIRHLELRRADVVVAVGSALLAGLGLLLIQEPLTAWWRGQILGWSAQLQLPVTIDVAGHYAWRGAAAWPAPAAFEFIAVSAGTLAVFGASYLLPDRLTPVKFALRILCLIQASALLLSQAALGSAASALSAHLGGIESVGREVMLGAVILTPLVEGLLRMPALVRIAHAALMAAYFNLLVPTQVVVHAFMLDRASVLLMPLLHLFFGVLLNVMLFVAVMSMLISDYRPARTPGKDTEALRFTQEKQ